MIRLHDYRRSSASYRVRIALGLAGLEWHSLPVDLVTGAQASLGHLARNPQGLVPVVNIDGANLTQSLAILEYLDATRGPRLWPDAPLDCAGVRAIAADIHPVRNLRVLKYATGHSGGNISIEAGMQAFIAPSRAAVEAIVTGDQHSFGSSVRLANLCLLPQLYNGRRWRVNLSDTPNLTCIGAHLQILPAFAATHPDLTPR
jgi:maleylacetoacetate isomerase